MLCEDDVLKIFSLLLLQDVTEDYFKGGVLVLEPKIFIVNAIAAMTSTVFVARALKGRVANGISTRIDIFAEGAAAAKTISSTVSATLHTHATMTRITRCTSLIITISIEYAAIARAITI